MNAPTTPTTRSRRLDSDRGMQVLLLVLVTLSVAAIVLVGA